MQLDDKVSKGEIYQDFVPRLLTAKSNFEEKRYIFGNYTQDLVGVKTITFQVTEDCNLACTYCYQINKSKDKMKFEDAKKFIDLLIKESYNEDSHMYYKNTPGICIEFIGGEPLLEVDLINEIYDYFRNRLIEERHPWAIYNIISLISNGVNYMSDKVQNFLQKNRDLTSFSISLDGNKELHDACRVFNNGKGSYDIAVQACKHYMQNYKELMFTKMTLAPENIEYTFEAIKNLMDIGYKFIHANCVYEDVWDREKHPKIFYNQLIKLADFIFDNNLDDEIEVSLFDDEYFKPYNELNNTNYCGSTCSMLAIGKDGDIYPCVRFMESSLGKDIQPYSIGSIHDGIGVQPEHKERFEKIYSITRTSQSSDKCNNCQIGLGCGWCTALNYQLFGTPDKRLDAICELHQARSLANVYYWNKRYRRKQDKTRFTMHIPKDWALNIISEEEYNMLLELSK